MDREARMRTEARQRACEHDWGKWDGSLSNFLNTRQCRKCWKTETSRKFSVDEFRRNQGL